MDKEQNLIKKSAKELGEVIGLSEASIRRLATSAEINNQVVKSIEMLLEIEELSAIGGLFGAIALFLCFFRINALEKRIDKIEKDNKDFKTSNRF